MNTPRTLLGSCFTEDSFTGAFRPRPVLSPLQAFCLSEELPASFAKLTAALRVSVQDEATVLTVEHAACQLQVVILHDVFNAGASALGPLATSTC